MVMAKVNRIPDSAHKKNAAGASQKQQKRTAMMRMLIMILVDLVAVCVLLSISSDGLVKLGFREKLLIPLTAVFGVLALGSAVYQVLVLAKKIDTSAHYVTPTMLLCVTVFALLACLIYLLQGQITLITIAIASAVATVLFVVYYLYMHVFYR